MILDVVSKLDVDKISESERDSVCVCVCVCVCVNTAEQTEVFCQHLKEYFLRKLFNWKLMAFAILSDTLERPLAIRGIPTHTYSQIFTAISHFLLSPVDFLLDDL